MEQKVKSNAQIVPQVVRGVTKTPKAISNCIDIWLALAPAYYALIERRHHFKTNHNGTESALTTVAS